MDERKYRLRVLKLAGLSERDAEAVGEAIMRAEKNTSGEIVAALTPASHTYSFWELFFALTCAALAFVLFMAFFPELSSFAALFFWGSLPERFMPLLAGALIFLITALLFCFANIPAIDRLIVPAAYRNAAVFRRAMRFFAESGIYDTREHSGILIFISLLEKKVFIIADRGISSKIEQVVWDNLAAKLSAGFSKRALKSVQNEGVHASRSASGDDSPAHTLSAPASAIVQTIEECGVLLAKHFPPSADNPDELHNGLVVLEGGE